MEARSERATTQVDSPSAGRPPVAAPSGESDSARHVATTDVDGALLYLATLAGELISAVVRGFLVAAVVTIVGFVTGHSSRPNAVLLGWLAGVAPLAWSLSALVFPSSGWWWSTVTGARRPSARELSRIDDELMALTAGHPDVRPPRRIYVLDDPEPNAAVLGEALMVNRGLLDSRWLAPVLAHELGHIDSSDGRLTDALTRLVLRRSRTTPRQPASGCLGLLAQLVLLVAGGGSGLLLTRPFWAAYWRSREYVADAFAARLGQGSEFADFLITEVVLYDRPVPFAWMSEVGHPPTELRLEALSGQPFAEPNQSTGSEIPVRQNARSVPAAAALGLLALAAIVIAGTGITRGGSGASVEPSAQSAIENALAAADQVQFAELVAVSNVACHATNKPPVFDCTWWRSDQTTARGQWELYNGQLARVSNGGDGGRAPTSDAQADQIVDTALRQIGPATATARCLQLLSADGGLDTEPLGEYTCELLNHGKPVGFDPGSGDPIRTVWQWNPDGSLATQVNDDTPVADETTR
jgi:Zn-dependent protease with chaperone function